MLRVIGASKIKNITQFILARHGETKWNQVRRLQGHLDSPLTKAGLEQANFIAESTLNAPVELLFSSPLGRAKTTAQSIQQKLAIPLHMEQGLIERHFGDWQGAYFDDLVECSYFEQIFSQVTQHAPPNGESGVACAQRISNTLIKLANESFQASILVITHGDAIRCFMNSLYGNVNCDAYSQYGNGKMFPIKFCHLTQSFS